MPREIPDVSVIIPVSERCDDLTSLHHEYRRALEPVCRDLQFIYVLDGPQPDAVSMTKALRDRGEELLILQFGKCFGEAAAINAGLARARHAWIMILPAYSQVAEFSLARLIEHRRDHGMVIARRQPRVDAIYNRFLGRAFNSIVRFVTGTQFNDLGCGVRLTRREVLDELSIYGDQHRFLPVLAELRGFSVTELELPQSVADARPRRRQYGALIRRLLDLVSVFFLARFTKKPLRFFGLIGTGIASIGAIWMAVIVIQRLAMGEALADRPALVLASLLIVLGVQVFALGLVSEIIIYTHAREIREYAIEEIV